MKHLSSVCVLSVIFIILIFILSGCNIEITAPDKETVVPTAYSSAPTTDFIDITEAPELKNISISQREILSILNDRLEKKRYPKINTDEFNETKTDIGIFSLTVTDFSLKEGIDFYFIRDDESNLIQFVYRADRSKLSLEDHMILSYVDESMPYIFEPDAYTDLSGELNLSSDAFNLENEASGETRDYTYIKEGNISMLYVVPKGRSIISMDLAFFDDNNNPDTEDNEENPESEDIEETPVPETGPDDTDKPEGTGEQADTGGQKPPVVSGASFTGGLGTEIDINTGKLSEFKKNFRYNDTVYIAGKISGISGKQALAIDWLLPEGTVYRVGLSVNDDNESISSSISATYLGIGSGSVSIILVSTGEVLETYYFTISE